MRLEQLRRMHLANRVLQEIADAGQRFFRRGDEVCQFENAPACIGGRATPAFWDVYSRRYVYLRRTPRAGDGFTFGPGLRQFAADLEQWIRVGGLPPEIGDRHWGYGDELIAVRARSEAIFEEAPR